MNRINDRAIEEKKKIWNYVEEVLENPDLLQDFNFTSRIDVEQVFVILVGGDLICPDFGLNYIQMKDDNSNQHEVFRVTGKRDLRIKELINSIFEKLDAGDLEGANSVTDTRHKVIYICLNEAETQQAFLSMIESGFNCASMQDHYLKRVGDGLAFVFGEEYSYFEYEDSGMWM